MKKFILALCLAGCAISAQAQTLTISDETAGSPDTQAVTINYTAGAVDLASFSVRIDYDPAQLTPQTDAAANPNVNGCVADLPASHTGAFTGCNNPTPGAIALTVTDQLTGTILPTTSVGSITFDVAAGLAPGTISPIEMTFLSATDDTGSALVAGDLALNDGSITISVTPGESFFSSSPVPGSTIDFGSAVVGTATTPDETITVSNLSTDTAFDITAAAGNFAVGSGSYSLTSPAIPATVAASGSVDLDLNCTPGARGNNTGTFTITTDADNVTSADYPTVCTGLSPNVAAAPLTVTLNGTVGGTDPSGSFDITNAEDGFASDALNAALSEGAVPEISITDGLTDTTISVNETDAVTVECSAVAAGTFSETLSLQYDDPVAPGGVAQIDVTVDCNIANAFPVYESVPTPGSTLDFGSLVNGNTSGPLGVDVGNSGAVGGADLNVTGASISGADAGQFVLTFAPFTIPAGQSPDGTDDISVICDPDSIGTFSASLAVNTDDPAEPGGGFSYPLECESTSNAQFSLAPAVQDGVLSLGTVAPGTTASGTLTFSNAGTDPLTVTCDALTDDNGGVITANPDPISFTLPPDSGVVTFEGTPPEVGTFEELLANCTVTGDGFTTQNFDVTVAVSGRPLVIPTMSRWGLVVMSLVLLLVAGVAGRRMLA